MMGFAVAVAAFVGATHVQAAPQMNEAVVRGVRGTANYSTDRGANWRDLKVGARLKQNSIIRTAPGATVDLFLGDNGPVVRVTENTTMGIDRLTVDRGNETIIETQLDLRSGRILGNVKKLAAASKYEVKTPQGVAGIRGTRYDISADGTVKIVQGDAIVVYVLGGRTSTATLHGPQMSRPPTTAGGEPIISAIPPAEVDRINREIDSIPGGPVPTPYVEGQPTILTINPIQEQIQGGDRAKVETEINGVPIIPTGNNHED
jgi:hypothetical protein